MDNRGFFTILNQHYKGKTMQFIPAFSSSTAPPFPYASYQIRTSETDLIKLDSRDRVGDKIIEHATDRVTEELLIKCYDSSDEKAYKLMQEVQDLVNFQLKELLNSSGYGIIRTDRVNTAHEKTDNSYVYCYMLQVTIDFNRSVTREFNVLKVVELTEDVKDKINMEV